MVTIEKRRQEAIESGLGNARDTMREEHLTWEEVTARLSVFVSDGLNCAGLNDLPTAADMQYAREVWS